MSKLFTISIDTNKIGKMYHDICSDFDIGCCLLNSGSENYIKYCSAHSFDKFLKSFFNVGGTEFDVNRYF